MSNMEVDYPIQDFELGGSSVKAMVEVVAKNFKTIVNIIQNREMYDMIHLNHLHELCQVLRVMINDCNEDINLFSENNKLVGSFRDAGLDMNNISSRRNKLFPTLTPWQLRDTLDQLETVLNFLTDSKFGLINDFKINNLFSMYKINNIRDLTNSVHGFMNNHYRFGSNIQADFSIMVKDGKTIEEVIKKYKREKYLNDCGRRKIKDLLSSHLVYEISFHFEGLGLSIKPLKNF
nr:P27 [Lettuce chlorosis virus]